jgi:hypothetical protein
MAADAPIDITSIGGRAPLLTAPSSLMTVPSTSLDGHAIAIEESMLRAYASLASFSLRSAPVPSVPLLASAQSSIQQQPLTSTLSNGVASSLLPSNAMSLTGELSNSDNIMESSDILNFGSTQMNINNSYNDRPITPALDNGAWRLQVNNNNNIHGNDRVTGMNEETTMPLESDVTASSRSLPFWARGFDDSKRDRKQVHNWITLKVTHAYHSYHIS